MIRLILIISLSFVAANCGQKGPLEPPKAEIAEDKYQVLYERDSSR